MDPVAAAVLAIDAANRDDPTERDGQPLALVQGQRADTWVRELDPHPSDALTLAARAHHLRRWVVPRSTYPEGRAGYLRWRRDQKKRHADELRSILRSAGIDDSTVERASVIVTKVGLGTDPEVQVFEDAVSLTFLETQYRSMVDKVDDDAKMVDVVAKTLRKMSEAGRRKALTVKMDDRCSSITHRALAAIDD